MLTFGGFHSCSSFLNVNVTAYKTSINDWMIEMIGKALDKQLPNKMNSSQTYVQNYIWSLASHNKTG